MYNLLDRDVHLKQTVGLTGMNTMAALQKKLHQCSYNKFFFSYHIVLAKYDWNVDVSIYLITLSPSIPY